MQRVLTRQVKTWRQKKSAWRIGLNANMNRKEIWLLGPTISLSPSQMNVVAMNFQWIMNDVATRQFDTLLFPEINFLRYLLACCFIYHRALFAQLACIVKVTKCQLTPLKKKSPLLSIANSNAFEFAFAFALEKPSIVSLSSCKIFATTTRSYPSSMIIMDFCLKCNKTPFVQYTRTQTHTHIKLRVYVCSFMCKFVYLFLLSFFLLWCHIINMQFT